MRFNEIEDSIMSHKNGSITTKKGLHFSDIHLFTKILSKRAYAISLPHKSDEALLIKDQLIDLLNALGTKSIRLKAVGARK